MGFIDKKTDIAFLRAKLTDKGRDLLSKGLLNYRYWVAGDSEIDYNVIYDPAKPTDKSGATILAPKDLQSSIKYPITSFAGGDAYNSLNGAQSIQKVVNGANIEKGFFANNKFKNDFVNSLKTKKYFKALFNFEIASLNGGLKLAYYSLAGEIVVGDMIMITALNPTQGSISTMETVATAPTPYLWYKVKSLTATELTLDRNLPNMGAGVNVGFGYVVKGGDAINDYYSTFEPKYWDYDNLSYQDNDGNVANDVKVWNFNVVYKEPIIGLNPLTHKGINSCPSRTFAGVTNIDSTLPEHLNVFGVIHYTNNSTTNTYGESFKRSSLKLTLPNLMYHRVHSSGNATTMGATFLSVNKGNADYDELIDSLNNVVGRVYFKSQIIILIDEELTTALSYRGGRSWTLPKLNVNAVPSANGLPSFVTKDKTLFVSYYMYSTTTGFLKTIPCQSYSVLNSEIEGQDSAMIFFPRNELPFLKATLTAQGGFTANKVILLAQLVNKGDRPNPTLWKSIDITATFGTGFMTPALIEGKSYTLTVNTYNSAPLFNLTSAMDGLSTTAVSNLLFGEENVFMGSLEVIPSATVHKASFVFPMLFNQFRTSTNPTYTEDGGRPIYVSEVGVYNENKELVIIGKTSKPLLKGDGDTLLIQVDIDF